MDDQAFSPPFNQANHGDLLHQLKQRAVERRSPNQVLDGFIFCRFGFALSEKKWEKPYFGAYERLHNKALFFGVRLRSDLRKCSLSHRTFVAPLERLKLEYIVRGEQRNLFELIKAIAVSQGLKGFWKGNFVNILRTAPFKSINFYAYDTYRNQLLKMSGNEETTNFER